MHLVQLHKQALPTPGVDANGSYVNILLGAAGEDREREPPDEGTGRALRRCRIESENAPIARLAGLSSIISHAAKSYQADFDKYHNCAYNSTGRRVCVPI